MSASFTRGFLMLNIRPQRPQRTLYLRCNSASYSEAMRIKPITVDLGATGQPLNPLGPPREHPLTYQLTRRDTDVS